jgi:hypothetical protein
MEVLRRHAAYEEGPQTFTPSQQAIARRFNESRWHIARQLLLDQSLKSLFNMGFKHTLQHGLELYH